MGGDSVEIRNRKRLREVNTLEVTEEWIEDKVTNLFVILNILRPSSNDVENVKTFIRTLYREAGCFLR